MKVSIPRGFQHVLAQARRLCHQGGFESRKIMLKAGCATLSRPTATLRADAEVFPYNNYNYLEDRNSVLWVRP